MHDFIVCRVVLRIPNCFCVANHRTILVIVVYAITISSATPLLLLSANKAFLFYRHRHSHPRQNDHDNQDLTLLNPQARHDRCRSATFSGIIGQSRRFTRDRSSNPSHIVRTSGLIMNRIDIGLLKDFDIVDEHDRVVEVVLG